MLANTAREFWYLIKKTYLIFVWSQKPKDVAWVLDILLESQITPKSLHERQIVQEILSLAVKFNLLLVNLLRNKRCLLLPGFLQSIWWFLLKMSFWETKYVYLKWHRVLLHWSLQMAGLTVQSYIQEVWTDFQNVCMVHSWCF